MSAVDRIIRKLNFMQVPVNYLKSIDPENVNLEDDYVVRSAIERNFQLAIECAIDIGEIISFQKRSLKDLRITEVFS